MARIRSIKPEFWTDSTVVGLSTHARLLFIGCWNFADDYGVLEDDSTRLKLQILPAEPVNADDLVDELVKAACLVRAVAPDGTPVLVVRTWERHQKVDRRGVGRWGDPTEFPPPPPDPAGPRRVPPNPSEPSSSPPEPSESASDLRPPAPSESLRALVDGREGKGREGSRSTPSARADRSAASDRFEQFWEAYPRRDGRPGGGGAKKPARERFAKLSEGLQLRCLTAAPHYAAYTATPGAPHPAHAATWLHQERWDDWQTPAEPDAERGAAPRQGKPRLQPWHAKDAAPGADWEPHPTGGWTLLMADGTNMYRAAS